MTPEELYTFAREHLLYEADMLTAARALGFTSDPNTGTPVPSEMVPVAQLLANMRIESCVMHIRNLIDFLYPTSAVRDDDVHAGMYIADWESKRPPISSVLDTARKRAGKEMNHLTARRKAGTPPEKAWDFEAISTDLRAVVKVFLDLKPHIPSGTIEALGRI